MSLSDLLDLLHQLDPRPSHDGESVGELDHALQCGYELTRRRPHDVELHVAGLVHDIGHRFGGDEVHGVLGADAVRPILGERVAALVAAHVPAKRYLVAADPSYRWALSDVSATTLAAQGGPLSSAEAAAFRSSPHLKDALELRRADDAAKVPGRPVPGLDEWIAALRAVAR